MTANARTKTDYSSAIDTVRGMLATPRETVFDPQNCPVRDVFAHIGDKWASLILQTLGMQPEGGLQAEFRRIARDNPARALSMITGPKVSATLSSFRLSRVHEVAAASVFEAAEDTTVMARVRMGC